MKKYTSAIELWRDYRNIKHFPLLDLSNKCNFDSTWYNCQALLEFPYLDLSAATTVKHAWDRCKSLTSFPQLDLSKSLSFHSAWGHCKSLKEFPELDLSNGVVFEFAWYRCKSLVRFPLLKLVNADTFYSAWEECFELKHFPPNMFDNLTEQLSIVCFADTWKHCNLTAQSIENILVSIDKRQLKNETMREITLSSRAKNLRLTPKTFIAINSLKSKNWNPQIQNYG